ncbi:hypothetical protein PSEUDO8O_170422 [Pseudomonas sp. 8O]|nr:hypothetical protein PSEUDO8O_170422 [Pseudomonas sp. 8O]
MIYPKEHICEWNHLWSKLRRICPQCLPIMHNSEPERSLRFSKL